ncbi:LLM class flavin-dependent oxidoreductase [Sphingomonas sp. RS6]
MKFGLSLLPDAAPGEKSPVDYYRDAMAMSAMADDGGMHTVKMTEHYGHPYGGYCPDPLMFLVAVAQTTRRIRVMTGCILPVFHHPVQLASRIALADVLTGGRLDVGFARAFLPSEFDCLGIDLDESPARFEAVTRAVAQLFDQGSASADTPYFAYREVALLPPPVQRPHPPFWGAAARSRSSFARIGENGFNLLTAFTIQSKEHLREQIAVYRDSRADAGHAGPGKVTMLVPLFVDRDDAAARRKGFSYLRRYHATWERASTAWRGRQSSAYPGYTDLDRQLSAFSPEDLFDNGSLAFGDPARVCDRAERLADLFGVDQILWNVDFGAMPRADALGSLDLFLEHCMPVLTNKAEATATELTG